MTAAPYYASGPVRLLLGDAARVLDDLPDASADCVVTSPPYYGLRDYGAPDQLGLQPTPAAYVSALRGVFARLARVLAPDGVAWVGGGGSSAGGPAGPRRSSGLRGRPDAVTTPAGFGGKNGGGLPPKSLLGMPWRVALALQDDGWLLRSCVIWHKPNGKPESVRDRPATRHEYLFLLARQPGYWFDLDPIRRPRTPLRRREAGKTPAARGGANPGTAPLTALLVRDLGSLSRLTFPGAPQWSWGRCLVDLRESLSAGLAGLPRLGEVRPGPGPLLPYVLVAEDGDEVEPVSQFLRDLALSDRSPLTGRSYAQDLLRWWRLLGLLEVRWDKATTAEVAVLVGWLRNAGNRQRRRSSVVVPGSVNMVTGKRTLGEGYAASTINHCLSVVSAFYAFHAYYGRGPVVNPVPERAGQRDRLGHRSPLDPFAVLPRARLRQRLAERPVRAIPDHLWDELFAQMGTCRDRALLALYVSSGARASELLGLRLENIDWAGQRISVISKGSRTLDPVPASPEAFGYLARYLGEEGLPDPGQPVWRTLHGPVRPLAYGAMRQVLNRANDKLGANWTLHDLRHTAAARMARDPGLTLPEVQKVMRHAQLSTTQRYLAVDVEEMFDRLQQHYRAARPQVSYAAGYDPADVTAVFGD